MSSLQSWNMLGLHEHDGQTHHVKMFQSSMKCLHPFESGGFSLPCHAKTFYGPPMDPPSAFENDRHFLTQGPRQLQVPAQVGRPLVLQEGGAIACEIVGGGEPKETEDGDSISVVHLWKMRSRVGMHLQRDAWTGR